MKSNKFFSKLRIALFVIIIGVGCVVGFIIPWRPAVSDKEGRNLTEFPKFTVESFISGEYTSSINLWYSDTFPARDTLMDGNSFLKSLYGIKTEAFEGKGEKDEINLDQTFVWEDEESESAIPGGEESKESEETEETEENEESETEPAQKEVIDGYYVNGDTAYQLYYFDQDYVDRYTKSVVNAAIKLDGIADVYDIVVPTSPCIYLSDEDIERLGCSDGNEAIKYIYKALAAYSEQLIRQGKLSSPVKTLDAYPCLYEHRDEYIYYRTDHHWTGLGAYYTSRFFLDEVGRDYPPLSAYKEYKINGFLGTLYKHTQNPILKNNPDTVYAYESPTVKKLTVWDRHNEVYLEDLIINPNVTSSNKYLCFSSGDRAYYEIHNETVNDGSAILVIRESYGNAFLPMIADSYEYVYAVDYRFWDEDLVKFVEDHNIDTVLFLNNLAATVTYYNIWTLERCVK